jgi:stress response protein YsnF
MSHYGLLGEFQFRDAAYDIRGTTVYGQEDEKLGKIDDVIFDHSTGDIQYVVVDTGWLTTKKFIVPANRLRPSPKHDNDYASDLTKQQIENFPPFNESDLKSEDRWADYEDRYRSKWETGPVMHREGTDRNITPTTQQMRGNQSSLRASGDASESLPTGQSADEAAVEAASTPTERIVPAGRDSVVIESSAVGIGERWDTFQERLRERRKEAVAECHYCYASADTFRKAG